MTRRRREPAADVAVLAYMAGTGNTNDAPIPRYRTAAERALDPALDHNGRPTREDANLVMRTRRVPGASEDIRVPVVKTRKHPWSSFDPHRRARKRAKHARKASWQRPKGRR